MAGEIKVRNKHNQLVILDADKLEDFKKAIYPLSISEYFRQHQIDVVEEYKKEKNLNALDNSALRNTTIGLVNYVNKDKNLTLDLFMIERREIITVLDQIDMKPLIGKVIGNAKVVLTYGQKRLNSL